ncbi:MAG: hypothetical protein U5J98_03250 [Halobacteriales archaeon]|nr:hypothetical protein [Halobacteriales archaeon]
MEVRDAVEADADALAELSGAPRDVLRNVIHDRTVRIAAADGEPRGFVSFDARPGTVYVTQLSGDPAVIEPLLAEPVRFATNESMSVELLVAADDEPLRAAAEASAFEEAGPGPRFDDVQTVRYRYEPDGVT